MIKKNATNLKRKCDNDDLQEKNTCQKEKKNIKLDSKITQC